MTNKQALTQKQRDNHARFAAMGVAKIERPLRLIYAHTGSKHKNTLTGEVTYIPSRAGLQAYHAARRGDGQFVKALAFALGLA